MVPAAAVAVYLYNSALFKLWYLSGQVEVYCFMSSMWLQLGRCVVDRRLCPVSDWGLGLVTGPVLIGSPPSAFCPGTLPPSPLHKARQEAAMWGFEEPWWQGWKDRLGVLDGSMDCFLLVKRRTQTFPQPHEQAGELISLSVP